MTMQPADLRAIRKSLGMTQEAFGEAIGVSRPTVGLMERGAAPITARTEKMVNALLSSGAVDGQIVSVATLGMLDRLCAALNDPATESVSLSRDEAALLLGLLRGLSAAHQ